MFTNITDKTQQQIIKERIELIFQNELMIRGTIDTNKDIYKELSNFGVTKSDLRTLKRVMKDRVKNELKSQQELDSEVDSYIEICKVVEDSVS